MNKDYTENLINFCTEESIRYQKEPNLREFTSFKTGGPAVMSVHPDTEDKLRMIVAYLNGNGIKFYILGKGSNVLALDDGFEGVILSTSDYAGIELQDEETIVCQCGASLMSVCRLALSNSLAGMEFAYGIPGTVGGGVYMNAGAYGGEMKDVLVKCEHLLPDGTVETFSSEQLDLGYRHSVYSDSEYIVSKAYIRLHKGDESEIKSKMDDLMNRRKDKQPLEYPSAGSTFKRPEGYFAGALIEESGLKGYRMGGAQVSDKHAGFIINRENASSKDVLDLIKYCQDKVLADTGVKLETEVKILK